MAHLRVQHSFQGASNLPRDRFVNVFHVRSPDIITTTVLEGIAASVKSFYQDIPAAQSVAIEHFMNTGADASGRTVKIYDMAQPMPRAPIFELPITTTSFTGSSDNLPEELAACLSYTSAPQSGIPVGRRRGRIYLGPFNLATIDSGTNLVQAKISALFTDCALAAAKDFQLDLGAFDCFWSVYSKTDAVLRTITSVSMDNAWDIQRRRGHDPTERIVVPL